MVEQDREPAGEESLDGIADGDRAQTWEDLGATRSLRRPRPSHCMSDVTGTAV